MGTDSNEKIEALMAKSEYQNAIKLANTEIAKNTGNGEALIARSVAQLRLGMVNESLDDAEKAVACTTGELRADAQLRRAFAFQRLGYDGKAVAALKYAKNCDDKKRYNILAHKLQGVTPVDIAEVPEGEIVAKDEVECAKTHAIVDTAPEYATNAKNAFPTASSPALSVKKDWYQSSSSINLDVYLRGAQDLNPRVNIGEQAVSIEYGDVSFKVKLAKLIDNEKSTYTVSPYKFSFVLAKVEPIQWGSLEYMGSDIKEPQSRNTIKQDEKQPNAPEVESVQPPKTQTEYKAAFEKNWDSIDSDDDDSTGASADPNEFFTQIYKNADPDAQRAMMKSFVESKGTTLSTNWDEVKRGTVEPQPPKDMNIR